MKKLDKLDKRAENFSCIQAGCQRKKYKTEK